MASQVALALLAAAPPPLPAGWTANTAIAPGSSGAAAYPSKTAMGLRPTQARSHTDPTQPSAQAVSAASRASHLASQQQEERLRELPPHVSSGDMTQQTVASTPP